MAQNNQPTKAQEENSNESVLLSKEKIIPFTKKSADLKMSERITLFIQNNRKMIIASAIGLVLALGVFIAVVGIRDYLQGRAIAQVEEFIRRNQNIANPFDFNDEGGMTPSPEMSSLIEELSVFASRNSGYAGARAFALLGGIHSEMRNWGETERAWVSCARLSAGTYLEPVSFFNAAAEAEEQGNIQGAVDLFSRSAALRDVFPLANRAQFQIGRLEESRGNREAALQAYRELINRWPNDATWTPLAHSRVIALTLPVR